MRRLVIAPRGTFLTGVSTDELAEDDCNLTGVDTRRATPGTGLARQGNGSLPALGPVQLDLMGITVDVAETPIATELTPPHTGNPGRRRGGGSPLLPPGLPT